MFLTQGIATFAENADLTDPDVVIAIASAFTEQVTVLGGSQVIMRHPLTSNNNLQGFVIQIYNDMKIRIRLKAIVILVFDRPSSNLKVRLDST